MNRVVVSSHETVFQCDKVKAGWLCGKCGQFIGANPQIGQACSSCKAKVEEAMDTHRKGQAAKL